MMKKAEQGRMMKQAEKGMNENTLFLVLLFAYASPPVQPNCHIQNLQRM